jgi:hypothetical protein
MVIVSPFCVTWGFFANAGAVPATAEPTTREKMLATKAGMRA